MLPPKNRESSLRFQRWMTKASSSDMSQRQALGLWGRRLATSSGSVGRRDARRHGRGGVLEEPHVAMVITKPNEEDSWGEITCFRPFHSFVSLSLPFLRGHVDSQRCKTCMMKWRLIPPAVFLFLSFLVGSLHFQVAMAKNNMSFRGGLWWLRQIVGLRALNQPYKVEPQNGEVGGTGCSWRFLDMATLDVWEEFRRYPLVLCIMWTYW